MKATSLEGLVRSTAWLWQELRIGLEERELCLDILQLPKRIAMRLRSFGPVQRYHAADFKPENTDCVRLQEYLKYLLEYREATVAAMQAIREREKSIVELKATVSQFQRHYSDDADSDRLDAALDIVNTASIHTVINLTLWSCFHWRPISFDFHQKSYLHKMVYDIHFLQAIIADQRSPSQRALAKVLHSWHQKKPNLLCFTEEKLLSPQKQHQESTLQKWIQSHNQNITYTSFSHLSNQVRTTIASQIALFESNTHLARDLLIMAPTLERAVTREASRIHRAGYYLPYLRTPLLSKQQHYLASNLYTGRPPLYQEPPNAINMSSRTKARLRQDLVKSRIYSNDDQLGALFEKSLRPRRINNKKFNAKRPQTAPTRTAFHSTAPLYIEAAPQSTTEEVSLAQTSSTKLVHLERRASGKRENRKRSIRPKSEAHRALIQRNNLFSSLEYKADTDDPLNTTGLASNDTLQHAVDVLEFVQASDATTHTCNLTASEVSIDLELLDLERPFKLQHLPTGNYISQHASTLWDLVPATQPLSDDFHDSARRNARQRHWDAKFLSGVFAVSNDETLLACRWYQVGGWRDYDDRCVDEKSLVWCLRYGQRVCLLRGSRPTERVWCIATVTQLYKGIYMLTADNGAGILYDPTCQRRNSLRFTASSSKHTMHMTQINENSTDPKNVLVSRLGFDIDDQLCVVRVDDDTPAHELGVQHGWSVLQVAGTTILQRTSGGRDELIRLVAKLGSTESIDIVFEVFSHILCAPSFCYYPGQELSFFHITQWCDATVLRKAVSSQEDKSLNNTRLSVFSGNGRDSTVETIMANLNNTNHCLRFIDQQEYIEHLESWRKDRPEWGEMFDTVKRTCLYRERRLQNEHRRSRTLTLEKNHGVAEDDTPAVPSLHLKPQIPLQFSTFEESAPKVYTLLSDHVDPIEIQSYLAPTGAHWAEVTSLDLLTNALLSQSGDVRVGAMIPVRILLLDQPTSAVNRRTSCASSPSTPQSPVRSCSRHGSQSGRSLSMMSTESSESETNGKKCQLESPRKRQVDRNVGLLLSQSIQLAETAIHKTDLTGIRRVNASGALVRAAARKITTAWIRRSMAQYSDLRTSIGQLKSLLMTLSATRQRGHPSTHFVPVLLKRDALLRAIRRLDPSRQDKQSLLQVYFESAYSRSRPSLYRMLMQALAAGRIILLLDTSIQKTNKARGSIVSAMGPSHHAASAAKALRIEAVPLSTIILEKEEEEEDCRHALIDTYIRDRLPLEVHRLVIAGGSALVKWTQEDDAFCGRFLRYHVRRGTRAEHEAGLISWFCAQKGRFT